LVQFESKTMTENLKHHEYGPSGLGLLERCTGSHSAQALAEDRDSEAAAEGRLLHSLVPYDTPIPETVSIDQEGLVDRCRQILATYMETGWSDIEYERRVTLRDTDGSEINFGTVDVLIRYPDHTVIIDWKFGRVIVPSAETNIQLANYAAAIMQELGQDRCIGVVYQPRSTEPPTEYVFSDAATIASNIKYLIQREKNQKLAGLYVYIPGDWCRGCRALSTCNAVRSELPNNSYGKHNPPIQPADTLAEFRRARLAERYGRSAIDEIKRAIVANQSHGLALVERPGNRKFKSVSETLDIATENVEYSQLVDAGAISISVRRLEDLLAKEWRKAGVSVEECKRIFREKFNDVLTRGESRYEIREIPDDESQ